MARVSETDLRGVFGVLASSVSGTASEPISLATLKALELFVGADETSYFELRREDRGVVSHVSTRPDSWAPGSFEAMLAFSHENPLGWRSWQPADGALRLSEVAPRRDLERLNYFHFVMRPNGVLDTIKLWLWSSSETVACIRLDRTDACFTARDQDLVAILHQHLIQMRERALSGRSSSIAATVPLTGREAEVLSLAAVGVPNDRIAAMLGTSPATIRKHLEHAYEKLDVHSRAEVIARMTLPGLDH